MPALSFLLPHIRKTARNLNYLCSASRRSMRMTNFPDSLKQQIYEDGVQLPLRSVGQTFADVWFLVFGGLSHAADKKQMKYAHDIECYHRELSTEISKISIDKRIEPNIQVTAQALENSKYCITSKELRKMYVNLISKSIDIDYATTIHPSFAEIIKQMSPSDAKILKTIPTTGDIPIVDYIITDKNETMYKTKLSNVYLSNLPNIDIFKESEAISSLSRLGILNIDKNAKIENSQRYKPYKNTPFFNKLFLKLIVKVLAKKHLY